MILDSSVIVAVALREAGYEELVGKMRSADLGNRHSDPDGGGDGPLPSASSTGGKLWKPSAASAKGGIPPRSISATA